MLKPLTISGLIEALTPATLAEALGVSVQAISNMKQRDAIPAKHWPGVVALARQKEDFANFTLDGLAALHTQARTLAQRESSSTIHQRPKRWAARL